MTSKQIIIYQTTDGITNVDVTFNKDTLWLTLNDLSHLFGTDKSVISRHIVASTLMITETKTN